MIRLVSRRLRALLPSFTSTTLILLLSGLPLLGMASLANADEFKDVPKFDEQYEHSWGYGLDVPMNTIAGLTDWAQDINYVYLITTIVTVLIFFAVAIPVVYTIWRFKVSDDHTDDNPPKQVHGNVFLEFTWTIVPCILLIVIAVPTWKVIFKQAREPGPDALTVEVIGHQWWWEFKYPDLNGGEGIVTGNELVLPENREVVFKITSDDVIHSFWIPVMGGKVDALPGVVNTMLFTTPELASEDRAEGKYFQGQCVELCGLSHALMRFNVLLLTAEKFDSWAATAYTPPKVVTAQQKLGEEKFAVCMACHTIAGTMSASIPGDKIGPDLTNFGNRPWLAAGTRLNNRKNLERWLKNPAEIKPGSLMPNLNLSDEDVAALSAYIVQSTAKKF